MDARTMRESSPGTPLTVSDKAVVTGRDIDQTPVQALLPIRDEIRAPLARSGEEILNACREVARGAGKLDVLADDARMDVPQLSRALNGRGYNLGVDRLPAFFRHDTDRRLISLLCRLCGGRFVEEPRFTPEQELAAYKRELEAYGPLADEIRRKVHGEDA